MNGTINLLFLLILALPISSYGQQDTTCVGENGSVKWLYWSDIQGYNIENLYADPFYPQGPDIIDTLFGIEGPQNFNDYFGAVIKGFIKVPETGWYQFNVTGDDRAHFYFSTGTDPTYLNLICESDGYSGNTEHDKYPEQTSDSIMLNAGDYHYFELHHKANGGGDDATVYWKTPFLTDTLWFKINGPYLYNYNCDVYCEDQGTPCDDGDSTTINDIYDGYCHCQGEQINANACIGDKGVFYALYYDTISGNPLSNLLNAPKFPLDPDRADLLHDLKIPVNQGSTYGTQIQGFLRVPQAGYYQFNITGDDNSEFYMSDGEDPDSIALICEVPGWSHDEEYYKYPEQTSDSIWLADSVYYYFKVLHKEGYGGDHVYVHWRTPFIQDTNWRVINGFFIYGYDCELACIPDSTLCDDLDPNTTGDMFIDCACAGTPCGGPCDEQESYMQYASCDVTDKHSTNYKDTWLSCDVAPNPNPARDTGIWIMYDFGSRLKFIEADFWNYNVEGETGLGLKNVVIDYSEDGVNWSELGQYVWNEAPGDPAYAGDSIPALEGIRARYLLITGIDNWNNTSCMGFSEIMFTVERCLDAGQPCDDNDPTTINDMYDKDCNCHGLPLPANDCDPTVLILPDEGLTSGLYDAADSVVSQSQIDIGSSVTMVAGEGIVLEAGFEVELGGVFYAVPEPCDTSGTQMPFVYEANSQHLFIRPKQSNTLVNITFDLPQTSEVDLILRSVDGKTVIKLIDNQLYEKGRFAKKLPVRNLEEGMYIIELEHDHDKITDRFTVLNPDPR